ncbi:hypothetical protein CARUB_v10018259mg [Capsella rubella]|uniref:Protein NIM1-INTERACTING 2 n=1 Tax=Capsella rubella TaxID=81985 RepID=R0FQX1_9BRAS|nr:protein NIM1-INTERACTING 2 [Capsella rubella]EOA24962.1 hypothetical protein CARUB_v10018259mg [Capsella rubella]
MSSSTVMRDERREEEDNGKDEAVIRTVTEEEVDEFFKILRRVHVAARTAAKANVDGGDLSKKRKRSQSLGLRNSRLEDNSNGVVRDGGELDGIKRVGSQGLDLDLNSKPEPDGVSLSL